MFVPVARKARALFGNDVLLITTRGRISGKLRRTPVIVQVGPHEPW